MQEKALELTKVNREAKTKGILPVLKSLWYGSDGYVFPENIGTDSYRGAQTNQNFFQFLVGAHSFNRKGLQYLIETGYCQNPTIFGIITKIIFGQKNLKYTPYRSGKIYKSGVFDLDMDLAFFNIGITGTVVFWNKEVVGFGRQLTIINTVDLTETYFNGKYTYVYCVDGIRIDIPSEDLIIRKLFDNPSRKTRFGLSPLQAAIMPVEALREMYTADTALLKNKGAEVLISSGSDMPLVEVEQSRFDSAINERIQHNGLGIGRVVTTTAKVEVHQLGKTIKELALWDGYKIKVRDLCMVLQFPSSLANDPDSKTYANFSESLKSLYTECVIPFAKLILDCKEIKDALGYEVFIDTSGVDCLQEDQNIRAKKATTHQTAIIELNTKVKDGTISKEIATNILVTEWGYDQEEAVKMIMQEQPITEPIQQVTV